MLGGPLLTGGFGLRRGGRCFRSRVTLLRARGFGRRSRCALPFGNSRVGGRLRGLLEGTLLIGGPGLRRGDRRFRSRAALLGGVRLGNRLHRSLLLDDA